MGLDMYLSERKYFSRYAGLADTHEHYMREFTLANEILEKAGIEAAVDGCVYVEATVIYWRKANAIHAWFVKNVQSGQDDCRDCYVDPEQLVELRDLCQEVLSVPESAPSLLPTGSGFFFGSTEYGKWYFDDLRHTVEGINRVLGCAADGSEFKYHSSW